MINRILILSTIFVLLLVGLTVFNNRHQIKDRVINKVVEEKAEVKQKIVEKFESVTPTTSDDSLIFELNDTAWEEQIDSDLKSLEADL